MTCNEFENQILEDFEVPFVVSRNSAVGEHLKTCSHCSDLARHWKQLDVELTEKLNVSTLPADFNQRLAKRIESTIMVDFAAQRADYKRQIQLEYETGMAQLIPFNWVREGLFAGFSYAWPVALAGWCGCHFLFHLIRILGSSSPDNIVHSLLFVLIWAGTVLAVGLFAAIPQRLYAHLGRSLNHDTRLPMP